MYRLTHHYLTLDVDGHAVVEVETATVHDADEIAEAVRAMIAHPGGRSGTTISLTVAFDGSAAPR